MTGRRSSKYNIFRHDFCQVLRKHIGILISGVIIFLVLIPFSTAGMSGDSIFEIATTHEQMKFRFIGENFVIPVYVAVIVYGTVMGISTFRFVLEKRQTTLYFSVGLTRDELFFARFLTALISMAIVVFFPMTVSLALNQVALGSYPGMISCYFYVSFGLLLQGMTACLLGIIACLLAGTMAETLLFDALFLFGTSGIAYSVNQLWLHFTWGNAYGAITYTGTESLQPSLIKLSAGWNPLLFFYQETVDHSMFYRGLTRIKADDFSWERVIIWAVGVVILMILALLAIKRRKAETAEMAGLNRVFNVLLVMVSGFVLFAVVYVMFSTGNQWVAFGLAALATVLVLLFWQRVFICRKSKIRMTAECIVQMVVLAVTILAVCGGTNQYLKKIPDVSDVESVSVSYVGNPSYISGEMSGSSSGSSFYMLSEYTFDCSADLERVSEIHSELVAMGRKEKEANQVFEQTVVPYDIRISWELENGKELVRYYDRTSLEILEDMLVLDESEQIKTNIVDVITGQQTSGGENSWAQQAYATGAVYLSDIWYSHPYKLNFSEDARKELLAALAEDVRNQTAEQRYFPEKDAIGTILFTTNGEEDTESFSWHLGNAVIYVTDEFSHTLDFLEKNHLMYCMEFDGEIESIVLQPYNPYDGINGRKYPMSTLFLGYR